MKMFVHTNFFKILTFFFLVLTISVTYGSFYKRSELGSILSDCLTLCSMRKIYSQPYKCGGICERDSTCAFFFEDIVEENYCYFCSGDDAEVLHPSSILVPEEQVNTLNNAPESVIFKKQEKFHNYDRCKLISNSKDCSEIQASGSTESGVYAISLQGTGEVIEVYCDMDTDGGGWTVFQKRKNGTVDFNKSWLEYESGFGQLNGEFWLGNEYIAELTSQDTYELRVDMIDQDGSGKHAVYSSFSIDSSNDYQASIGAYSGTAGNSLTSTIAGATAEGMKFTTYDRDNDFNNGQNCAITYNGGWWFNSCFNANLNGEYGNNAFGAGVLWHTFRGLEHSLVFAEMKLRPVQ